MLILNYHNKDPSKNSESFRDKLYIMETSARIPNEIPTYF